MSATSDTSGLNLTTTEAKLLIAVIQNHKGTITPDWDAVAAQCGYSTTGAAISCWNRLRRTKLVVAGAEQKSPSKAKAKKEKEKCDDESPAKKKRKVVKKDVKEEVDDADGEEIVKEEIEVE